MIGMDELAEMAFVIFELDQVIVFDNGIIVDRDNFSEFMSFHFNT